MEERQPVVGIVMGSDSDLPVMVASAKVLDSLDIPYEITICSAHRTPGRASDYARTASERGLKVLIAGAGMAAALPGVLAAWTDLPVIGVPLGGEDALWSIVQMPPGIPVATVAIGGAKNAAYLAAQILALSDLALRDRLRQDRRQQARAVDEKDRRLKELGPEEYLAGKGK